MNFTFRERSILDLFGEGCTYAEVALGVGITRSVITNGMRRSGEFAAAVEAARLLGKEERSRGIWVRHPRRGKRPPFGKGHGGLPRYRYGHR